MHVCSMSKIHKNQPQFPATHFKIQFLFLVLTLGHLFGIFLSNTQNKPPKYWEKKHLYHRPDNSKMASNLNLSCTCLIGWGFGLHTSDQFQSTPKERTNKLQQKCDESWRNNANSCFVWSLHYRVHLCQLRAVGSCRRSTDTLKTPWTSSIALTSTR